jgi:hypothetical protein
LWGAHAAAAARLAQFTLAGISGSPMTISYEGIAIQPFELGRRAGLDSVLFHVLNFPDYIGTVIADPSGGMRTGRAEAAFGGWDVTLDNLAETKALREQLRVDGGYAITHVGQLRRGDGSPFTARSVVRVRDDLGLALSFARGGFSYPLLMVGRSPAGVSMWERWDDPEQSPSVYRMSWFDPVVPDTIPRLIPGFMARCGDSTWTEPMRRATILYLDANQHPRVEVGIVLAQVALELLSWALLVLDAHVATPNVFNDQWNAARRIRELLVRLGIPTMVPAAFSSLRSLGGLATPGDGPERVVYVRNRIAHPPKKLLASWPAHPAVGEAELLSLEFLELALLRLSGYRGPYWSRSTASTNPVPWP